MPVAADARSSTTCCGSRPRGSPTSTSRWPSALGELGRSRARRRRGILLSDAVHNAGPDPRLVAARFARLDVLLETDGEHDAELASELARRGRGEVRAVADHRAVAPALNRIFAR